MSNVDRPRNRASFFPRKRDTKFKSRSSNRLNDPLINQNNLGRKKELEKTKSDAKVTISGYVRDFSKIKKVADQAPEIDNSQKIALLREQIKNGSYKIDNDGLTDRIIESEF